MNRVVRDDLSEETAFEKRPKGRMSNTLKVRYNTGEKKTLRISGNNNQFSVVGF